MGGTMAIVILYFILVFGVALYVHSKQHKKTAEDYFLASRSMGSVVLAGTLFFTMMSGTLYFGGSGWGYKTGMGFSGAFMVGSTLFVPMIYILGYRAWLLGRKFGYISPAEIVGARFESNTARVLFSLFSIIYVIPYLSIQSIGAGHALSGLTQGAIPFNVGATIFTIVLTAYVLVGGFRSVAWTDLIQGILLVVFLFITFLMIVGAAGGFAGGVQKIARDAPELLMRPGGGGYFTPKIWVSWLALILFNAGVQPQIFQRYLAARSHHSLKTAFLFYGIMNIIVVSMSILGGAFGRIAKPGLQVADQIIPSFLASAASPIFAALVMSGALAAIMSTADSQLLTLSSLWTRDFYLVVKPQTSDERQTSMGRWAVVVFAVLGLLFTYTNPPFIAIVALNAYSGIAILWPAMMASLFWKRANKQGIVASILGSQILHAGFVLKLLPASLLFGFTPVIPSLVVAVGLLLVVTYLTPPPPNALVEKFFGFLDPIFTPRVEVAMYTRETETRKGALGFLRGRLARS
ncbi:MAG: sodium:solute symporter family protein [Firmicutes bacterium]|nr:sodium:solute symporter family protein [Bacillota bacterium]